MIIKPISHYPKQTHNKRDWKSNKKPSILKKIKIQDHIGSQQNSVKLPNIYSQSLKSLKKVETGGPFPNSYDTSITLIPKQ